MIVNTLIGCKLCRLGRMVGAACYFARVGVDALCNVISLTTSAYANTVLKYNLWHAICTYCEKEYT